MGYLYTFENVARIYVRSRLHIEEEEVKKNLL